MSRWAQYASEDTWLESTNFDHKGKIKPRPVAVPDGAVKERRSKTQKKSSPGACGRVQNAAYAEHRLHLDG